MFPKWVYLLVPFAIAAIAFGIGQIVPGLGVGFVILTSTLWTAYSVSHSRKIKAET